MLRSFRLGNHRSFQDEQELLLMPAAPGDDRSALPVAAIYGANASGKSNLLDGLSFMREAVLRSFVNWDEEGQVPRRPFRLGEGDGSRPSVFVTELIADSVSYTYGFSLDDHEIVEEWLYSYPEKRKRVIFERTRDGIKFGSTVGELRAKLEVVEELIRPNALFLSAAARIQLEPLMPVYRWFRTQLGVRALGRSSRADTLARQIDQFVSQDLANGERLVSLLTAADVGITDVFLVRSQRTEPGSVQEGGDRLRLHLRFVHGDKEQPFSLDEESAGTRNWLELLPVVLTALDAGHVVVVDEIDTSLHPRLTARLVGLFQDEETNPNGAQLIFTTHDTSLLGTMLGDDVLERDQVWFVEKGRDGASQLYPLTDFKPRKDQNTERRYLAGSYGAVPILGSTTFADAVLGR